MLVIGDPTIINAVYFGDIGDKDNIHDNCLITRGSVNM